jgi:cation:H+ antiporter
MFAGLSISTLVMVFAVAGAVVLISGTRITMLADRIADRTGFGEALVGGVVLGAATSMSGTVVSVTAALDDRASLAFSNGVGGIAAQTAFLALADLIYRRANLEHAAANLANIFLTGVLILLLAIPLLAFTTPEVEILGVHPASLLLVVVYGFGVYASNRVRKEPMWHPVSTLETRADLPAEPLSSARGNAGLFGVFLALVTIMGFAGWFIAQSASEMIDRLDISATLVGSLMTAVVTSLPELVTTLAAVRRGALQLAVGGIIGGNTFDTLFLTLSDISYRKGSIYHDLTNADLFWLVTGLVMSVLLLLGLLYRQRSGPAGMGIESLSILLLYFGAIALQSLM